MLSVPSGATPLSTVFEEYAADQEKWYSDFVDVFEKMLNNGYDETSLTENIDHETNVLCPRQDPFGVWNKFYNCYHDTRGIYSYFKSFSWKTSEIIHVIFVLFSLFVNVYSFCSM